jgi:hypothetical protein
MQRMRILLQQTDTGLYFKDIASWADNSGDAMDFVSSTAAIEFCAANKLTGLQIVLKFDKEKCDIVMPLQAPQTHQSDQPSRAA